MPELAWTAVLLFTLLSSWNNRGVLPCSAIDCDEMGSQYFLPVLASNQDLPDLHLSSS
jgi:hypothetical protein